MKLAIISPTLPPSHSGQAVVLYRLLNNVKPDSYVLISSGNSDSSKSAGFCSEKLPGKYFHIPQLDLAILYLLVRADYYGISFPKNIYVSRRAQKFKNIFVKEKCSHVIACSADLFDPYCAFVACSELKIPYYLYPLDDFVEQWINRFLHYFAQKTERIIVKGGASVIVPNEFLKTCYDSRYGIDSFVIHNSVDLAVYAQNSLDNVTYSSDSEITIVYTGAIYKATMDSLTRMAEAISRIDKFKIRFHIYSPDSVDFLKKYAQFIEYHSPLPLKDMPGIQKRAHILFLPLAFQSDYSKSLINTSSPLKMGEYLASGKPIIVHSPPDSYLSWYFKKYNCGIVVDTENEDELSAGILSLITDSDRRATLIENARIRAGTDFDVNGEKEHFFTIFKEQ